MSIDYQSHGDAVNLANQMQEEYNLENPTVPEVDFVEVDDATGEVKENEG
jgi:hypothetical protein